MPAAATVCGGIDALAHTIEILVGTANNEYTNQILFLCLNKIWRWLPVAVKEPENLEAREQMSWAAHNALANGGVPNGHAVAQISLAWLVDKKPYLVPIPGTRKLERLKENAGASDILLTPEEVKKTDDMLERIPMSEVFGGTKVTK